jgi:hypothetical protein
VTERTQACSHCGAANRSADRVCWKCDRSMVLDVMLDGEANSAPSPPPAHPITAQPPSVVTPPRKRHPLFWVGAGCGGCLGVFLLLALLATLFGPRSPRGPTLNATPETNLYWAGRWEQSELSFGEMIGQRLDLRLSSDRSKPDMFTSYDLYTRDGAVVDDEGTWTSDQSSVTLTYWHGVVARPGEQSHLAAQGNYLVVTSVLPNGSVMSLYFTRR